MGFDETADFVVVGSGGGSMCAAMVMAQAGKSTLILEKTAYVGGTTARSGGVMWIPNNRFMKRDGVADSFEASETYLSALTQQVDEAPAASAERRSRYLADAREMIDFLCDAGVRLTRVGYWPDYYDELPGGCEAGRTVVSELYDASALGEWQAKLRPGFLPVPATLAEAKQLSTFKQSWAGKKALLKVGVRAVWAKLRKKNILTAGAALQGQMLQHALAAGADIRTEAAVEELLTEEGRVVGVVVNQQGERRRIGARLGVLVNAGGFSHNQEMRDQYASGTFVEWTSAAPGDTGEMIREMARLGGALAQMDARIGNQMTLPPGAEKAEVKAGVQSLMAAPHAILVDQSGHRYMNEGGSYMAFCKAMLARDQQVPAVPSWAIFDSQFITKYMLAGTMPGKKKPQAWYDSGFLRQANDLTALAELIQIDPAALNATVTRFNGFVDAGRDADFARGERAYDRYLGDAYHRPSPSLGRIEKGPFYAIPVVPGDVGTAGGVLTNANAQVLRDDGSVISGLYATGTSSASVMGNAYPGAGASVGPSFVWGYVAAKHAASVA